MSYFPLDRDMLTSSLFAMGTPEQFKVFSYLLLSANPRTGIVEDADPAIAMRCALPLDVTVAALDWLASPDQYSRTKDSEGRRIERLPEGGVCVLNYLRRQNKDHSTPRVKRWRQRQKDARNAAKRVSTVTETTNKNKNKNTETNGQRTTDCASPSASALVSKPARSQRPAKAPNGNGALKEQPSWSSEACGIWQEHLGQPPFGRIGHALKPLVEKHGWGTVLPVWRLACAQAAQENDPSYFTPEVFARTFTARLAAPRGRGKATVQDRTEANLKAWMASKEGA